MLLHTGGARYTDILKHVGNTSPGLDGIPFSAFKKCRELVIPIFKELYEALGDKDSHLPATFNHATMVC